MIMSGSLAEWSVEDLLHLVRITNKTTSIRLIGGTRSGFVHLSQGAIVAVEVEPSAGDAGDDFSRAVDGIRALTEIGTGSFEFCSPGFENPGTRFDIEDILSAVHKDVARERKVRELGITDDQPLSLTELPAGPVHFQVQAWQLLAPLVPRFTLRDLDGRFGRGRAVATVLMLEALGVLDRAPADSGTLTVPPGGGAGASGGGPDPAAAVVSASVGPGTRAPATPEPGAPNGQPTGVRSMPAEPEDEAGDDWGRETEPPLLFPVVDPEDTLGAHYVEIFDHPSPAALPIRAGGSQDLTLVSDVLDDIRSRFRTGPSQLDAGFEDDE